MIDNIAIGKRLAIIREEIGINSQEEFYKKHLSGRLSNKLKSGSSIQGFMSKIENGTAKYTPDILAAYSEISGKSIDYLVRGEEYKDMAHILQPEYETFEEVVKLLFEIYNYLPFDVQTKTVLDENGEEYPTPILYFPKYDRMSDVKSIRTRLLDATLYEISRISNAQILVNTMNYDIFTPLSQNFLKRCQNYRYDDGARSLYLTEEESVPSFEEINGLGYFNANEAIPFEDPPFD